MGEGAMDAVHRKIVVLAKSYKPGGFSNAGKDLRTGNFKEITITDSIRLSAEEIEAMVTDAETHAAEYAAYSHQAELQEYAKRLAQQLADILTKKEVDLPIELIAKIWETMALEPEDWEIHLTTLQELWQHANGIKNREYQTRPG